MLSIPVSDDEYYVLVAPEKVAISKTVDFTPVDQKSTGQAGFTKAG